METLEAQALVGDPLYYDVEEISTPGVQQTLLDETVAPGTTTRFLTAKFKSVYPAEWSILANGELIGSGYAGPGQYTDIILWRAGRDIASGVNIQVLALVGPEWANDLIGVHIEARTF